jgi:hypothetical protein
VRGGVKWGEEEAGGVRGLNLSWYESEQSVAVCFRACNGTVYTKQEDNGAALQRFFEDDSVKNE